MVDLAMFGALQQPSINALSMEVVIARQLAHGLRRFKGGQADCALLTRLVLHAPAAAPAGAKINTRQATTSTIWKRGHRVERCLDDPNLLLFAL